MTFRPVAFFMLKWLEQRREVRQQLGTGRMELLERLDLLDIEIAFVVTGHEKVPIFSFNYETS